MEEMWNPGLPPEVIHRLKYQRVRKKQNALHNGNKRNNP